MNHNRIKIVFASLFSGLFLWAARKVVKKAKEKIKNKAQETKTAAKDCVQEKSDLNIIKICFTGGPCAGKSTAISAIQEILREKGYKVFTVPELPTLSMASGVDFKSIYSKETPEGFITDFQELYIKQQLAHEAYFCGLAELYLRYSKERTNEKIFILCDRGIIDAHAFMPESRWERLSLRNGWSHFKMNNMNYDMVLCFGTVADGAEEIYSNQNNSHRMEDAENARLVDRLMKNSWLGHQNLHFINTRPGEVVGQKTERAFKIIADHYINKDKAVEKLVQLDTQQIKLLDSCFKRTYDIIETEANGFYMKIIRKDGEELTLVQDQRDHYFKRIEIKGGLKFEKGKNPINTFKEVYYLKNKEFFKVQVEEKDAKALYKISEIKLEAINLII